MRHGNVAQLCRYCHIPLQEADNHQYKVKYKTVSQVQKLVDKHDLAGLQKILQIYLQNLFYRLRFNQGNDHRIHGAYPSEMLHALLLGIFKYVRDIFFDFLGPTSDLAKEIDAMAQLYSQFFSRQSDRSHPKCKFTKGIWVGKLMAKEFRGVLLIVLTILQSLKGKQLCATKKRNFGEDYQISDWILLVELLLEWETYLNEPQMMLKHVKRLERKHRYIMYIIRKVSPRDEGMGLKLMKFHAILHAVEDILLYGIPTKFDTGSNESHHKAGKQAVQLTQHDLDTFHFQTATRLVEFQLIDLAMCELEYGDVLWDYFVEYEDSDDESMDDADLSMDDVDPKLDQPGATGHGGPKNGDRRGPNFGQS
jgi:hypothetical protein